MVRFLGVFTRIDIYGVVSGKSIGVQNFSTDALRCVPAASRNVIGVACAYRTTTGLLHR